MNVFGIGLPEMALILVIALLVFGPKKLPEIGRSLGKAIRGFQEASREFETEFKREAQQIEQAAKTQQLPESEDVTAKEAAVAESNNHTTTSSSQQA
jgi:sec-independent protein translocase protein TatA